MNQPVSAEDIRRQSRGEVASQAAGVEHSRAVAEVQAAVTVAQRCPRDEARAIEKAKTSCRQWEVASTAFFKLPRGGESVTGETIHLAVELARCWGNIDYGIMELARDDSAHESEMLAFAWDLETNTKARMTFIVPHKRDKRGGPVLLTDMRDIYENNANNGARRLRECIFRVLPPYLKEVAKATCYGTLEKGKGDKPLEVRAAEAVEAFKGIGIARDRLEAKVGLVRNWTAADIANLEVSFMSIKRNEVSADEEFPRGGVDETVEQARAIAHKARTASRPDQQPSDEAEGPDDSQRGEANAEAPGDPDLRRAAIDIIRRAAVIGGRDEYDDLEMEAAPLLSDLPPALIDEVNAALDEAQARISRNPKGGK
ncbi:hypothetical protein SAMIE_1015240 [Sphingobium amiense]|uniref:Uncharacterized protein n=1 Tax=Sphingobium amiense TaxID=135719 RepID=A0A494W030_9SPHN|nr:hypothetical protein [Sphingobium amiense]BBD98023.1 hypothetical protein SAMIE_1015240 [Sphingobium amiense]